MTDEQRTKLLDPNLSNAEWITACVEALVLPKFGEKNKSYANGLDELHNIRQMAARNFPEEFINDKWAAMARVSGVVKDKHEVALARTVHVPEGEERLLDCLVYDFFRLRFKMLSDAEAANEGS